MVETLLFNKMNDIIFNLYFINPLKKKLLQIIKDLIINCNKILKSDWLSTVLI